MKGYSGKQKEHNLYPCRKCGTIDPTGISSYWTAYNNGTVYKASVSCESCGFVYSRTLNTEPTSNDYRDIWNSRVNIDAQISEAESKLGRLKIAKLLIAQHDEFRDDSTVNFLDDYDIEDIFDDPEISHPVLVESKLDRVSSILKSLDEEDIIL